MRVFLDTNVLVSGLTTRGLCAELFEAVISEHELFTGEPVLQELQRILGQKFRTPEPVVKGYLGLLRAQANLVEAADVLVIRFKDPDDIPILACALAAKADAFVTGDKDLLTLGNVAGMPIIDPRSFWNTLKGHPSG